MRLILTLCYIIAWWQHRHFKLSDLTANWSCAWPNMSQFAVRPVRWPFLRYNGLHHSASSTTYLKGNIRRRPMASVHELGIIARSVSLQSCRRCWAISPLMVAMLATCWQSPFRQWRSVQLVSWQRLWIRDERVPRTISDHWYVCSDTYDAVSRRKL